MEELERRADDGVSLIAMRRVPTIAQFSDFDTGRESRNSIDLLEGAVFVILSLNCEDRASYPGQTILDIPRAKVFMEPDIVPAAKRAIDIGVMSGEPPAQIRGLVGNLGRLNVPNGDVFNEYMGRAQDHPGGRTRTHSFMNDGDRCTVAVSEQHRPSNRQPGEGLIPEFCKK